MLEGHLDSITSRGFFEGWALDQDDPIRALNVSVFGNGTEVASGLAIRFRKDLMDIGIGLGWCAFKLRSTLTLDNVATGTYELVESRSGKKILDRTNLPVSIDGELPLSSVSLLVSADPTIIEGLWQLRQCENVLMQFCRRHGVEKFIDAAYAYVLGRAADQAERMQYSRCLRQGTLGAVAVLEALGDSEEFRSKVRQLAAPKSSAFPFV